MSPLRKWGPTFFEARQTDASRDLGLFTYVGVGERSESGGSIYCTLDGIDPNHGAVSVHRKLKPDDRVTRMEVKP